jgi:hypothetical protein
MSSIVVSGDTSGAVTLTVPAVAGTNTVTIPAATGTMIYKDANGTTTLNSNASQTPLDAQINSVSQFKVDGSGNLLVNANANTSTTVRGNWNFYTAANNSNVLYFEKVTQVVATIGFKSSTDSNFYVGTGSYSIGTYGLYQTNTGTSWIAVSDERFKTNLQPITNALEKISKVRAVTGRYTYDEDTSKSRPFLIAQDFVTALPEAVDQQNPDKLGLSYSDTIPLLVAAIKELKAEIDALKAGK